ncbi:hypothetical protein CROQUDRAFT_652669 [Cronartium quercuum f. sp. fusiforme G11]|uniref:Uncharacterized protein n=1 Tax=Cronartium quercuum f. sp. fusiforme G11 TaxID=708437 RepID=A0A9P6NTT2_9BASI|nr:hypothetical protein CROQUDRAFT_652669 [Cronartium quercuum f. sp. fusiforme G11]
MNTHSRAQQQTSKTPMDNISNMTSKPSTPPHASAPYKSVDFFMQMPTMMKHSVITLNVAGTKFIISMFHFPSQMSHVMTWLELRSIKFEPGDLLNDYLSKVRVKVDELDRTGFKWMKDSVLSIQMQLGLLMSADFLFNNVNMILDAVVHII